MSHTNEWEFQGDAISWVNSFVENRPLGFERATQEFTNADGRRSDLVLWSDHAQRHAVLAVELKRPDLKLESFQRDAVRKAQKVGAPYTALWNMRTLALYHTPAAPRKDLLADDLIEEIGVVTSITTIDDWLKPNARKELRGLAHKLILAVHDIATSGTIGNRPVDATVFVDALSERVRSLRLAIYADFRTKLGGNKALWNRISTWARKQGLEGFVDDLQESLAAQLAYRLVGQVLFYYSFRRYERSLPELTLDDDQPATEQLRVFWDAVRAVDYEALYEQSPLEEIPLGDIAQDSIRQLVRDLANYDWDSVRVDVLGSIFENMIPPHERRILGQYYTPPALADLVLGLTITGSAGTIFDPGAGTGTFLYRAHDYLTRSSSLSHSEILDQLWGTDISAFPAELAVINLYRLDPSSTSNFPRISVHDFFELKPEQALAFPPAKRNPGSTVKVEIPLPAAHALVGNPPYVRSQQLDDLDTKYKGRLNALAELADVQRTAKFDAFAYWIIHAVRFIADGGRLGLVVSGAWLNTEYGAPLQRFLLTHFQPVTILMSEAEIYFPSQDVNAIVVIAEKLSAQVRKAPRKDIRFITLESPLSELLPATEKEDYWTRVSMFASALETSGDGGHSGFRTTVVDGEAERLALVESPAEPRDWTRYLRMTPLYREIFP